MIPKILIVDRNADSANSISLVLQQQGYETIHCITGQEALSKAANYRPDLIVLDLLPPDTLGVELCKHIRATLEMAHLPILMLADAYHPSFHYTDLAVIVTNEYLIKPFHPYELVMRVRALLNQGDKC